MRSFPGAEVDAWADGLVRTVEEVGKPLLVSLSGLALQSAHAVEALASKAIPCFATPGRAVTAATALAEFSARIARARRVDGARLVGRVDLSLPAGATTLSEREAKQCLAAYGIPVVKELALTLADVDALTTLPMAFPVAVKVDTRDVPHKTEAGGVRVGVSDLAALKAAAREVVAATRNYQPDARIDGVLVQEMARGVEMLAGSGNDPVFGPYIVLGMGGIYSEVLQDTTLRFAPFGIETAREMIAEIKGARILAGYRGAGPHDVEALAQAVARLSWLVADHAGRIAELDVNPLFVRPAGSGVVAADCLIVVTAA